jgi:hypothetical protein
MIGGKVKFPDRKQKEWRRLSLLLAHTRSPLANSDIKSLLGPKSKSLPTFPRSLTEKKYTVTQPRTVLKYSCLTYRVVSEHETSVFWQIRRRSLEPQLPWTNIFFAGVGS